MSRVEYFLRVRHSSTGGQPGSGTLAALCALCVEKLKDALKAVGEAPS